MNNSLTTQNSLAIMNYNPGKVSLLEIRRDKRNFPRIKDLPIDQVIFEMTKIISQAFLYKGQEIDPTNVQFISSALVHELLENSQYGTSSLTLAEIHIVIKRAVLGGSEMFGLNVASFNKVLVDFAKGEGHENQVKVDREPSALKEMYARNEIIAELKHFNSPEEKQQFMDEHEKAQQAIRERLNLITSEL